MVAVLAITDNYTIKVYGHGDSYIIQDYHSLEEKLLREEEAIYFRAMFDLVPEDNSLLTDKLCNTYFD